VADYNYHIEFLTATILRWQHLLAVDKYKQIIVDSLHWLHKEERCKVFGFVIMHNHIHLIWRINDKHARGEVQGALLSYTAHQFKEHLRKTDRAKLNDYFVGDSDRTFQFWERDSRVKECWSEPFLLQKLAYIHYNPCQPHWKLATLPEEYQWSSASFYFSGCSEFDWLHHYAL